MFFWAVLVLALCVSAVLGTLALKVWFWAQRLIRRTQSRGNSVFGPKDGTVSAQRLSAALHETSLPFRARILEILKAPDFHDDLDEEPLGYQERCDVGTRRLQALCAANVINVGMLRSDPARFFEAHEIVAMTDASLAFKMATHFGLFGGTLLSLGSENQQRLIDSIDNGTISGCFALAEVGYGNNAVSMKTTATFDRRSQTIELHTPVEEAAKQWVVNGGPEADYAVVFARLLVGDQDEGVHPLLCKLREGNGNTRRGVTLQDTGHMNCCGGVSVSTLWFDRVRVPCDNLLEGVSQVSPNGEFTTTIPGKRRRFLAIMDRLLTGRMCFASISLGLAKLSIAAAVKYSENRRGFGLEPESPFVVMSYGSQMRSLIPRLAQVFAMQAGLDYCASQFRECFGTDDESLGTVVCAVKSYVTWTTTEIVNECRERMGAQGLLSRNQVAPALPEAHACITGEGDNNLLCQKTCRDLVVQFGADMKRRGWFRVVAEMSCGHVRLGFYRLSMDVRRIDWQLYLFRERVQRMLLKLAKTMAAPQAEAQFNAWNQNLDLVISISKAHAECLLLEQLAERANTIQDYSLKMLYSRLASLYALWTMEQGLRWFIATDLLIAADLKVIESEIWHLCCELRPDVTTIVDALGLPEHVLRAPAAYGSML